MKTTLIWVTAVMLLAAPVAVQNAIAQVEFTLGGGMNTPLGDYADQSNVGYAITTGLGYRVTPLAAIGVELNYNGNGASDEASAGLDPGYDMSSSILQYGLLAKVMLPVGDHSVFAKGSFGSYRGSAKVSGPAGDFSFTSTDPGYGVGGGMLINGDNNTSLFLDATYHHFSIDGSDGATTYWAFTLGALIRFDLSHRSMRDDLQDDLDKLKD